MFQMNIDCVECQSARDLQIVSGYGEWRNFTNVIEKAKEASGIGLVRKFILELQEEEEEEEVITYKIL